MSSIQKVDFESLDELVLALSQGAAGIEASLAQLDRDVAPLKSQWTGEAADAYQVAKAEMAANLADMQKFLTRISRAGASARTSFAAAEQHFAASL